MAAAGLAAGGLNAVAGGGTLVSYPALLWAGLNPILANTTSCVALLPGSLGGAAAFAPELRAARDRLRLLALPSLLGGIGGSWLLLETSPGTFRAVVPFLILGATLLMAFQDGVRSLVSGQRPLPPALVAGLQVLIGVYGGFFGAGIGILMLAALSLLGVADIHQANGLKNVLAFLINGVSAVYFVSMGSVDWPWAGVLALGAMAGGYLGARAARRLDRKRARRLVVAIGLGMSLALFLK